MYKQTSILGQFEDNMYLLASWLGQVGIDLR